ncbi:MAG TPA: transcriptional repressor [Conexibacter sp.]|nr:transcriptional repressor [Conexibacter sp.]
MTAPSHTPPLAFDSVDDVADALRRAGGRLTTSRRLVLEALFAARQPITAEQIANGFGRHAIPSDLASVYRNLERLEELGVVSHVHAGHGPGRYALAEQQGIEYLACDRCGKLTPVPAQRLDAVREQIREQLGHHARFSHFPLHGFCASCARRMR